MSELGKSIPHDSAHTHVTGESRFIGDLPRYHNELIVDLVQSTHAHAEILSIDISQALTVEGVVGIYSYQDIPGVNHVGAIFHDDVILADHKVEYYGQAILIIAAEDHDSITKAKKLITIQYRELAAILSIEDAIQQNSFLDLKHNISRGDIEAGFRRSSQVIEGELSLGGQEHFYLESQSSLVIPQEDDSLLILSSTQHTTEVQLMVSEVLGISANKVVVETKRLGGGFGGKESQAAFFSAMAAIVAQKTKRAARIVLEREQDFLATGKRHPSLSCYKVGFNNDGTIVAYQLNIFLNGGYSSDVSTSIMDRALFHADNGYYIENMSVNGAVCRTNYASNTAFRGFGAPQGIYPIEFIIEKVASILNLDPAIVRRRNIYGKNERNITHYGQTIHNNQLTELIEQLYHSAHYEARRKAITEFNQETITKVRGISLAPVKFGIAFTAKFLNQATALVNIYRDSTIQISTGGIEMGQGLNSKLIQIAAHEFGITRDLIRIMPTSTEKSNNTSPTAASSGTDLNGGAVVDACRKIKSRLNKFILEIMPVAVGTECNEENNFNGIDWIDGKIINRHTRQEIAFSELVTQAYFARISLGERGFYATPNIGYDWEKRTGNPFQYYTNAGTIAEVEVDRFTGEVTLLRGDILIDIGKSINPTIDKGQIMGAFTQGFGWVVAEELKYTDGRLLNTSPTTYKIPGANDIPDEFNIQFFDSLNEVNVAKSKAVGEPPFVTAVAVWLAIADAIKNARQFPQNFQLPATPEVVLNELT